MDKFLVVRIKKKKEGTNKYCKGGTITKEAKMKMLIEKFYQQLYGNTFENLEKDKYILRKYITY